MPSDHPAADRSSESLEDKFTAWLNRPLASRADDVVARMQAYHATPLEQQCALHADVLREAVRAAADRTRDGDKLTPEQAAVAVVVAFQGAQKQLSAAVSDDSVFGVLGRIRVDVLADGLLHVRSYIDGKCDSGGLYFPREAGPAISKTIQEVRDAVASRVVPR